MMPYFRLPLLLAVIVFATPPGRAASTIDATNSFAYGANAGWVNLRGDVANGVAVGEAFLSGKAWAANFGWIDLGDGTPANGFHYSNTSASDFGVNHDGAGNLSGYAYAANVGWINFDWAGLTNPDRPRIDLLTGTFSGYAYGANIGWINLGAGYLVTNSISRPDSDTDGIADAWEFEMLAAAGFPPNLATLSGVTDQDGDGVPDDDEYLADTNPFDLADRLRITDFQPTFNGGGFLTMTQLTWTSSDRRLYDIQTTGNLATTHFADILLNIPGAAAQMETTRTFLDQAVLPDKKFYRVNARLPLP